MDGTVNKQQPTEYFSWALTVALLARGHLFVDLLPSNGRIKAHREEDDARAGQLLAEAVHDLIEDVTVVRFFCSADTTPEDVSLAIARAISERRRRLYRAATQVLDPSRNNKASGNRRSNRRRHRRQGTGTSVGGAGASGKQGRASDTEAASHGLHRRSVSRSRAQQQQERGHTGSRVNIGDRRGMRGSGVGGSGVSAFGGALNGENWNMSHNTGYNDANRSFVDGGIGSDWGMGQSGRIGTRDTGLWNVSGNNRTTDPRAYHTSGNGFTGDHNTYNSNGYSSGGIGNSSIVLNMGANKYGHNSGEVDLSTAESYVLLLNNVQAAPQSTLLAVSDMLRLRTIHVPYDDGENDGANMGATSGMYGNGSMAGVGVGAHSGILTGESKYLRVVLPQQFCVIAASSACCVPGTSWCNSRPRSQPRVPLLPLAFFASFLLRVPLDPIKLGLNMRRQSSPPSSPSSRSQGNTSLATSASISYSSQFRNDQHQANDRQMRHTGPDGSTRVAQSTSGGSDTASKLVNTILKAETGKARGNSHVKLEGLLTGDLVGLQALAHRTYLSHETRFHLRDMVSALRMHPLVAHGPSMDACVRLERATIGVAVLAGRGFVTPTDLLEVVIEALSHLVVLSDYSGKGRVQSLSKGAEPPACFLKPDAQWHPLTAARFVVHQVYEFYLPVLR